MKDKNKKLRIGVFVCNCGTNIAGFLDAKEVAEYAKSLPEVTFARENLYSCSEAGVSDIKNAIVEQKLDRVVVAACTPLTHEPLFRAACEEAGVNSYFFEFVNIREHCSWVHKGDERAATKKAKDLVRMGVARASLLEALEPISAEVNRTALIIGGGIAGLTAALSLARRGFSVKLVEREALLGGKLNKLHRLYPGDIDASQFIEERRNAVLGHQNIEVFTRCTVGEVNGYIGNYRISVAPKRGKIQEITAGIIIVATGADVLKPEDYYGYPSNKKVIDQVKLEMLLKNDSFSAKNVVLIKCVGARIPERAYCSRICCMTAIKNALLIKERDPETNVHILYRDLMCCGIAQEELLRRAKELGVRFIRYELAHPPVFENGRIKVYHSLIGRELSIKCDLLTLVAPMVPREGVEGLSKLLKVPLDEYKFFLEAHVKLRPLDFATDGIYVCGAAHWPCSVAETMQQALGAAARASIHLTAGKVKVEPIVSVLFDEDACRGCGLCAAVCPYGAIELVETEKGVKARMVAVACKGCGTCGATCYVRAIKMSHYSDEQLLAQVKAAVAE